MMDAAHYYCIVCAKVAFQCCSTCQTVHYCSKEHQVADWKQHKVNCKNYKVEWDINTGHHIVASKDIAAGILKSFQNYFGICSNILLVSLL